MAKFAKHFKQSANGWQDKAVPRQILGAGRNAEVSLFGGGGDDGKKYLRVVPHDSSICTIHEITSASGSMNWRRFVITGLRKGDTWIEAKLAPPDNRVYAYLEVHVIGSVHGFRLVFFPGERAIGSTVMGTIYVIGGGGEHFSAAGGLPFFKKDRGGHTAEPTPAGHYTVGQKRHVTTTSWVASVVPWGAALRLTKDHEVEFKALDGKWHMATGPKGEVVQAQIQWLARENKHVGGTYNGKTITLEGINEGIKKKLFIDEATGDLQSPTYRWNDFGRWGWNLLLRGAPTSYYIHTTAQDEQATEAHHDVLLGNSHGCIHLIPVERDRMEKLGYLKPGVDFEVRRYNEQGPP